MSTERPPIPESLKRKLRTDAGFGCCRCGFPFVEYHHIIPYSIVVEHKEENLMVVCSRCHDIFTANAIPEEEQRKYKKYPYNLNNVNVSGEIFLRRNTVNFGGSYFRNNGPLIVVDGEEIVGTYHDESGNLLLFLSLYDKDNNLLARVVNNEWQTRPDKTWDLEAKHKKVILRESKRNISLKVELVGDEVFITGEFWKNGHLIKANSKAINVGTQNSEFLICEFSNCFVDVDTKTPKISIKLGQGLHPNQAYKIT